MQPRPNDTLRGILLMLGGTVLFSMSDATAKYLREDLPAAEIAWIRWGTFLLLALLPLARGRAGFLRARRPVLQAMRGLATVASALLFIAGLGLLPLAEASSISFVSPMITTALSVPLLRETVGPRRWAAVAVGLLGVLVVARPGTAAFQPAALLPLLSAAFWSVTLVLTRMMAGADSPATTLFWTALWGFALLCLVQPFVFVPPAAWQVALGVLIGLVSSGGQMLLLLAFRHAPASVLAPFSYAQLVCAMVWGILLFGTWPDAWTCAGATLIVGSGLYTAHRERAGTRPAAPSRPGAVIRRV